MKASKLWVFLLTFVAMIAITPLVFNKLMNAKFNQMLENLKQNGVVIKELENKSSYLKTDRVFDVIVPGSVIQKDEIKYIHLYVEAIFKNLPVTDVRFKGKVLDLALNNFNDYQNKELSKIIKDKIKFLVITPDFKHYKYKIFDNKISFNDLELGFSGIEGIYSSKQVSFLSSIIYFKSKDLLIQSNNLKNIKKIANNEIVNDSKTNLTIKLYNNKIFVNNLATHNVTTIAKKVTSVTKSEISDININNRFMLKNINFFNEISGVDYETIKEAKKDENRLSKLIEKGFNLKAKLNISDVFDGSENLGFFNLNLTIKFLPVKNAEDKFRKNELSFIDGIMVIKTTPKIQEALMSFFPYSMILFMNAKHDKNMIIATVEIKNNEVLINGQKVK